MDITEILTTGLAFVMACGVLLLMRVTGTQAKRDEVLRWVNVAVNAVEQVAKTETGKQKKVMVKEWLAKQGVRYDEAKLDMAIEAEVNKMRKQLAGKE